MWKSIVTAPPAEPITVAGAKAQLNISTADDDDLIAGYITSARLLAERHTNRALVEQVWDIQLDHFPWCDRPIHLPLAPLQSVTSITYLDSAGDSQVMTASLYKVDANSKPPRIALAYGQTWPGTRPEIAAVTVRAVFGYAPDGNSPQDYAANIPQDLKDAIGMLVGDFYENREGFVTAAVETNPAVAAILSNYVVRIPIE